MKLTFPKYVFKGVTEETPAETTLAFLMIAVNSKYEKGLDSGYKRIYARMQNKLEEAIEKGSKSIELEQAEYDLLKNAVKEAKVPAQFVSNFVRLEDAIEEAEKTTKK